MQLSVIIVNYNVKYFLEQCLHSVIKASGNIEAEIIVVDNASTDGSEAYLPQRFPSVQFIWNETNAGFGKASNQGSKKATGAFLLFLNPDTLVPEDCFERCIDFFRTHKDCGALGVRMIDGSGRFLKESKRSFPSVAASFYKIAGLTKLMPASKTFAAYYAGHLPDHKNNAVDVLAGAFMMLDRRTLEATKGFDEDFFMYAEDIDLSYRIQKTGAANYYLADVSIIHFKGESTQKSSPNYIRHFYGAMKLFVEKHSKGKYRIAFTKAAINANQQLAFLLMRIRRKGRSSPKFPDTAILASQQVFEALLKLVRYADPPLTITGRIATGDGDRQYSLGTIGEIKKDIRSKKIAQIIFCEADVLYKEMISSMQAMQGRVHFLFHAKGSETIIGSNEKNGNGIAIARPANQMKP